jgi:serine/threonine protein kinase
MSAAARFSASFPAPAPALPSAAAAVLPAALSVGERLGVWRVSAVLAACESGRWYRVEHQLAADERAALLVYQHSTDAVAALLRFAELAGLVGGLNHPSLALPLDSGLTPTGQPYIVLQWPAEGLPLLAACAELPLRQRLQPLVQLCEALQQAHEQGLLLRELDPGLLWLVPGQRALLMALGLAELAPEPGAARPQFSAAALPFVAPELRDGGQPSLASEAYAVGLLACWLVNGRAPRPDANGVLMPSAASMAGLSTAERFSLEALLLKALTPDPAARHPSARELGEDLRAWLEGRDHSALALTPMPTPAPAPTAQPTRRFDGSLADAGEQLAVKPARRKGWRGLLGAAAVAVLLLGGWVGHEAYSQHLHQIASAIGVKP